MYYNQNQNIGNTSTKLRSFTYFLIFQLNQTDDDWQKKDYEYHSWTKIEKITIISIELRSSI
jgi:hypothetical protein